MSLLLYCVLPACTSRKREEELRRKEARLNEREQQLLVREKTLQFQEEEIRARKKQLDSASRADTALNRDPNLAGNWNVRMTCIETTCPGSAVGDTKTEQWNIGYQNNHVIARAMAGDRLVRVYSGLAGNNTLELIEHRDSTDLTYDTRMVVRLRLSDANTIEGQREIIRENDCKIVYALAMTKQ